MQMLRPLDGTVTAYELRDLDMAMDLEHQQPEDFCLAPSLMTKQPSQAWNSGSPSPGFEGAAQTIYRLTEESLHAPVYPLPQSQGLLSPYTTSHHTIPFLDHENCIYNKCSSLFQPYPNVSVGCQPNVSHAPGIRQRQQQLPQPGLQQAISSRLVCMNTDHFTPENSGSQSQYSLTVPVTGSQNGAVEMYASLDSPPAFSQPSCSPCSPSTFGPLTPQCPPSPQPSLLPSSELSTPSEAHLFTDAERLPIDEVPLSDTARFSCTQCPIVKRDLKSLQRHIMEKHDKPAPGEIKVGWFRCACGASACHYRKANHTRHLNNCKPHKWSVQEFVCQCLITHSIKADHIAHYMKCSVGKKPVGRPRGA